MEEEWRDIPGFPGYRISNLGRVFNTKRDRFVKVSVHDGYPRVNLRLPEGKATIVGIHRLIAFAFIEGYFEGAVVNHIDGNPGNHNIENLEWVTHAENIKHAWRTGLAHGNIFREDLSYDPGPLEPW